MKIPRILLTSVDKCALIQKCLTLCHAYLSYCLEVGNLFCSIRCMTLIPDYLLTESEVCTGKYLICTDRGTQE